MNDRVKITACEVNDDYCMDVLVTCVEGGSNYWAVFRNVERLPDLNIKSLEVQEDDQETASSPGWHKVGIEDIRQAVKKVLSDEIALGNDEKTAISGDDNDACSSDCLLQIAALGEVVYG